MNDVKQFLIELKELMIKHDVKSIVPVSDREGNVDSIDINFNNSAYIELEVQELYTEDLQKEIDKLK